MIKLKEKDNIWFTADTHFNHKNICYGVSDWDNKEVACRKFETIEDMNQTIIDNINRLVGKNDILFHLGDWSFSNIDSIWNFRKQINCKNIFQLPGNHDHHIKNDKILPNCHWSLSETNKIEDGVNSIELPIKLQEKYGKIDDMFDVSAKDLFTEVLPELVKIKIDNQEIILSHYPIDQWENMDWGAFMLHGHTHHTIDDSEPNKLYRRKDVGIDNPHLVPYSWSELKNELLAKPIKKHYNR